MRSLRAAVAFVAVAFALLSFLSPRIAHALVPIDVTAEPANIGARLELFRDPSGMLGPAEAAAAPFTASTSRYPNFGFTRDAVWVRFALRNTTSETLDLVLDIAREWVDAVDVFVVEGGQPRKLFESGARVPMSERPVPVERIAMPIELAAGEMRTYLVRIRTDSPVELRASLEPRRTFMDDQVTSALLFGGYYAILLGIGAYSLILFANLRDKMQAGVGVLLISYAVTELAGHGHLSRLLRPGLELPGVALGFAGVGFTIPYVASLVLPATAVRTARALGIARWNAVVLSLFAAIAPPWRYLCLVGATVAMVAATCACVVALRERSRMAIYFTLTVGAFVVPMFVTGGTLSGLFPAFQFNEYGNHAGAVAMSLLLSLLVADSIRTARTKISSLQVASDGLNDQLSAQVEELAQRAKEVDGLNEELRFQVAARSRELVDVLARQAARTTISEPIRQGDVFESRYRVEAFLGHGGMGSVYEVVRVSDGRALALKVVTSATSGADAARVAREAEIGARVAHPNLVRILDVGVARHGPYLVMELVRGGALDNHKDKWSNVAWVLPILRGIAAALNELHRAKVVHRDLKPANVLLDGLTPKVADFGIARVEEMVVNEVSVFAKTEVQHASALARTEMQQVSALAGTFDMSAVAQPQKARLTEAHAIMGTPLYMAPESASGASALGSAVDIFAFGVMAIEMLTGEYPYEALPILEALAARPHPRHRSATNISAALAHTLDACLELDPSKRPSFAEILAALEA